MKKKKGKHGIQKRKKMENNIMSKNGALTKKKTFNCQMR